MAETAELIFKADSSQLNAANDSLERLNKTGKQTERVVKTTAGGFRNLRSAAGQLGFQVQDVAVQLQSGTNAMVVLGQQGSQVASIFGPTGAIVGALIAVGAAVAGSLIPSLFKSADAAKFLETSLDDLSKVAIETDENITMLSKEVEKLASQSLLAAQAQIAIAIQKANKELSKTQDIIEDIGSDLVGGFFSSTTWTEVTSLIEVTGSQAASLARTLKLSSDEAKALESIFREYGRTKDIKSLTDQVSEFLLSVKNPGEKLQEFTTSLIQINSRAIAASEKIEFLSGALKNLPSAIEQSGEVTTKIIDDIAETEAALTKLFEKREADELEALKRNKAIQERRVASVETSLLDELERIMYYAEQRKIIIESAANDEVITREKANALVLKNEEQKQAALTQMAAQRAEQDKMQMQAHINSVADLFGNLSILMSSENKKAFQIGKAAAIADATIKGILATINSYEAGSEIGGPVVGAIFAAAAAAATGAMIGQINSAQPPGRALGGQVRPGQTYRVGEFGPENITLGSNGGVITPAANDGGAVNLEVTNNVKVMGGNANVTTQTTQVSDKKFVTDIVVDLMANQSSPARNALHRTSNVQPVGNR